MLAYHPVSGKEIRVIQTDASMWKDRNTLIYGEYSPVYDTVFSDGSPTFRIQLEPASSSELQEASRKSKLLFLSNRALSEIGVTEFKNLNIENVLNMEELHNVFPHIGDSWDGTYIDAIVMIASLMRYKCLGSLKEEIWNSRASSLGLVKVSGKAPRLWWLTQYYVPGNAKRRREIQTCLQRNSNSKIIDKIILLNEEVVPLGSLGQVPIEQRVIGRRLTYADVIRIAADFPSDVIVAFANADICIDDASWTDLWKVNMEDTFLALLRYDVPESGRVEDAKIFGPRADSQDTWVIRVADIVKRGAAELAKTLDFQFGRMGCDNVIALDMLRQKFMVVNPALSLKTWHFHSSALRTYDKDDVIERPVFHYVQPSGFHDLRPVLTFSKDEIASSFKPASLARYIRGSGATKWLSVVNKANGEHPMKMENANTIVPVDETILTVRDCFQTPNGLLYDKERLLIGSSTRSQNLWSTATVGALTPSLECKRGLVAAWPEGAETVREIYVLKYLSKILQLAPASLAASEGWEFFCPDKREIIEAMETFDWRTAKLPVIKHETDIVVWCKEVRCFPPSENVCVLAEDVDALRKSVRSWSKCVKGERLRLVVVEDGSVMTESLVRDFEELADERFDVRVVYPHRTSAHRMTETLSGAWGIVFSGGISACGWNWMLPVGAYSFEISGGESGTEGLGISAASGLQHMFCSGGPGLYDEICKQEVVWRKENCDVDSSLPLILMPRSDIEGYFGHPGDSFREMVRLWEKAGLCRVKEHISATMVWWGAVGRDGVLLYDRPNHDWRLAAPAAEKEWSFALFGNPKPPAGATGASPWFFWPRRPALVETAADDVASKKWDEREAGIVFFGKIENKVQERRRGGDWASICSKWNMARGDEPHALSQQGYLDALASSRFGLCLAGYGYKCHREVECMAMGCVPICAPDVDMSSYADPPVAGVHYIRAASPEAAAEVAATMEQTAWETMSAAGRAWWKKNCSCAGSFALTKQLIDGNSCP
jgi:hypothetical protein